MKNINQRANELSTSECIVWDPWCVRLDTLVGISLLLSLVFESGTAASTAFDVVCWLAILCVIVRSVYLWRRRKTYDFTKSRMFFKRYFWLMLGLDAATVFPIFVMGILAIRYILQH